MAKDPNRKDANKRWKLYYEKDPHDDCEDDWDRLYLPSDEDDDEDPLMTTLVIPILSDSPHVSRHVAAQCSRFMILGTDRSWLAEHSKCSDSKIAVISIPAASEVSIKQELHDARVTKSVAFPDLDGLGRELKQKMECEALAEVLRDGQRHFGFARLRLYCCASTRGRYRT
jgi:hypothetical protein